MKELPNNLTAFNKTSEFTESTIPAGLLKSHLTKTGTWAKIIVLEGELAYQILKPEIEEILLSPDIVGVIEPAVPHQVKPIGSVRFYVEFYS